jgi:hypothetical protein
VFSLLKKNAALVMLFNSCIKIWGTGLDLTIKAIIRFAADHSFHELALN